MLLLVNVQVFLSMFSLILESSIFFNEQHEQPRCLIILEQCEQGWRGTLDSSSGSLLELTSRQDFPCCMSYVLYIRQIQLLHIGIQQVGKYSHRGKFSFFMCLSVHIFSVLKGEGCTNFFMQAKHFI